LTILSSRKHDSLLEDVRR